MLEKKEQGKERGESLVRFPLWSYANPIPKNDEEEVCAFPSPLVSRPSLLPSQRAGISMVDSVLRGHIAALLIQRMALPIERPLKPKTKKKITKHQLYAGMVLGYKGRILVPKFVPSVPIATTFVFAAVATYLLWRCPLRPLCFWSLQSTFPSATNTVFLQCEDHHTLRSTVKTVSSTRHF